MKTKEFEIEVVTTKIIKVILPETYNDESLLNDWEKGLWEIPEGVKDIAEYAAEMMANFEGCSHDGIGSMIENNWTNPNYEHDPYQVVAYILEEDVDVHISEEGEWNEAGVV